jgi:hypothetical protein
MAFIAPRFRAACCYVGLPVYRRWTKQRQDGESGDRIYRELSECGVPQQYLLMIGR